MPWRVAFGFENGTFGWMTCDFLIDVGFFSRSVILGVFYSLYRVGVGRGGGQREESFRINRRETSFVYLESFPQFTVRRQTRKGLKS
jgi:hypothetical protein